MNAQDIMTISAAVVALTQLVKWAGIPDKIGPLAVLLLALIGVVVWGISADITFQQSQLFGYFSAWVAVATSAAGVFGFTRAGAEAVTRAMPPPGGAAGSSPTTKS